MNSAAKSACMNWMCSSTRTTESSRPACTQILFSMWSATWDTHHTDTHINTHTHPYTQAAIHTYTQALPTPTWPENRNNLSCKLLVWISPSGGCPQYNVLVVCTLHINSLKS